MTVLVTGGNGYMGLPTTLRIAQRTVRDADTVVHLGDDLVYNVGRNRENYQISEIAEEVRRALDRDLEIVYLEDEHPGPSYHVSFDRLAETGFALE